VLVNSLEGLEGLSGLQGLQDACEEALKGNYANASLNALSAMLDLAGAKLPSGKKSDASTN
jgi:hypothetical protein